MNLIKLQISRTFQFSGPVQFVCKYYKIILAMLLPWCVKVNAALFKSIVSASYNALFSSAQNVNICCKNLRI